MHGVLFEDVLDRAVAGFDGPRPTGRPEVGRIGTAAAYGIFFQDLRPAHAGTATIAFHDPKPVPPRAAAGVPGRAAWLGEVVVGRPLMASGSLSHAGRSERHLTTVQRRALADLTALGAAIDASFTRDELRTAFRVLARRYHPDRHASRSDVDPARLSAQFRRLHDAYRVLARA
jgi:hypothetical protein